MKRNNLRGKTFLIAFRDAWIANDFRKLAQEYGGVTKLVTFCFSYIACAHPDLKEREKLYQAEIDRVLLELQERED